MSIAGRCMAASTASGMLVGPGWQELTAFGNGHGGSGGDGDEGAGWRITSTSGAGDGSRIVMEFINGRGPVRRSPFRCVCSPPSQYEIGFAARSPSRRDTYCPGAPPEWRRPYTPVRTARTWLTNQLWSYWSCFRSSHPRRMCS